MQGRDLRAAGGGPVLIVPPPFYRPVHPGVFLRELFIPSLGRLVRFT